MNKHFALIVKQLKVVNPEALLWDGFEDALVGTKRRRKKGSPVVAAYDYWKMVEILMTRDKISKEDAREYIEFNVTDGWLGDSTPVALDEKGKIV